MSSKPKAQQIINFSDFIHPRNPYKKYDYESISKSFLEFKCFLKPVPSKDHNKQSKDPIKQSQDPNKQSMDPNKQSMDPIKQSKDPNKQSKMFLDWSDREAVRCLMKCCLKRDFGLELELPEGCLAPALALKMNYLLWLEDTAKLNNIKEVAGLDIGTAGAIYFCSMAAKKFGWKMIGTETNSEDFSVAQRNIEQNKLQDSIRVLHNTDKTVIFPPEIFAESCPPKNLFFSLCNPPFFDRAETRRDRDVFTEKDAGRDHEMMIEGGEVDFITKMIDQSIECKDNIQIFTTLVGLKKSLGKLLEKLSSVKSVKRWVVNQFCQGKTMRWCLAWTFQDGVLLKPCAPVADARHQKKIYTPVRFPIIRINDKSEFDLIDVYSWASNLIRSLDLEVTNEEKDSENIALEFRALTPTWRGQRAKRRQEKHQLQQGVTVDLKGDKQGDVEEPQSKKAKLDIATPEVFVLCGKIQMQQLSDGSVVFDIVYQSGDLGKNGIAELSQYFKSRLNSAIPISTTPKKDISLQDNKK